MSRNTRVDNQFIKTQLGLTNNPELYYKANIKLKVA